MQPEPVAAANGSCHMSRDIVWLSDRGRPGSLGGGLFRRRVVHVHRDTAN
jgi:hypothetical protein